MADRFGDTDFDRVPAGPLKGRPWRDVPALTLHGLLLAVDFGIADNLDERRVWAIHEGLRAKDDPRSQQLVLDLHNICILDGVVVKSAFSLPENWIR